MAVMIASQLMHSTPPTVTISMVAVSVGNCHMSQMTSRLLGTLSRKTANKFAFSLTYSYLCKKNKERDDTV